MLGLTIQFPNSYQDVQQTLIDIENDIGQAECGGWIPFDTEINVEDHIARVSGVPGRDGEPFGNILSGMASRIETGGVLDTGLQLPTDVTGYISACRPGSPPFFKELPCQRPGPGIVGGSSIFGDGDNANTDPLGNGVEWTCDAVCSDMNRRWGVLLWTETCPDPDDARTINSNCYDSDLEDKPEPPEAGTDCSWSEEWFYCCTQSPTAPNCIERPCIGEECHTPNPIVDGHQSYGAPYLSYYRRYEGSCQRDPIPPPYVTNDDSNRLDVPVSCYGVYNQYDPKVQVSRATDYSCVIANTYAGENKDFTKMGTTQKSNFAATEIGKRMLGTDWLDPPSTDYHLKREPNEDLSTDLWRSNSAGGFSMVNNQLLENSYKNNLTQFLLSPDESKFKTYPQLSLEQPLSTGALLRAFDETADSAYTERRFFSEWWQEQETEMAQLLTPPSVRLVLPAPWVIGIDKQDPFLLANPIEISSDNSSVEVLLQAKEDLLGEVAAYFERSPLLEVKEEALPVLVPFGNPVELRALADSWCTWYMERDAQQDCSGAPNEVHNIMDGLRVYADRIEEVRLLRSELYYYEASILERQQGVRGAITMWLKDNIDSYKAYIDSLEDIDDLRRKWARLQNKYREFNDKTNMPWCMNDRFTTPIYSLLDYVIMQRGRPNYWYPGRPGLTGGIDSFFTGPSTFGSLYVLPRLSVDSPSDVVFDLSHLYVENSLAIPVLKPIQIRLEWSAMAPPSVTVETPEYPDPLPPLPILPTIHLDIERELASVTIGDTPPTITSSIPNPVTSLDLIFFRRIDYLFDQMDHAYKRFWKSLSLIPGASKPDGTQAGTEEDCIIGSGGEYEIPCVHTEMDLRERFQRMCARPAILLKEDFEVVGERRNTIINDFGDCPREDWACQLQNRYTEYSREGWALKSPPESGQQNLLDVLRRKLFQETLFFQNRRNPNKTPFIVDLDEITPSFRVPETEDITPEETSTHFSP
ncbi:hypothetical protein HOD24_00870 [Candidatus Peregrinibacteria bacterium]|nr:hypothetical protein [Candidatus Peregrinibacteria bacterium]MBT4585305.1 hypothetical protein [Candidatus Peregrinibacteria bacterium]